MWYFNILQMSQDGIYPKHPYKMCHSPTSIIQISRSSTLVCLEPVFREYLLVTFCVCGKIWVINIHIFIIPTLNYPYNFALSPRVRIIEVWLYFCCTDMLFLLYLIMGTVLRYSCALDKFWDKLWSTHLLPDNVISISELSL